MLHIIAHRGNLNGANAEKENHPDYIKIAIEEGFGVEVDLWADRNEKLGWNLFLGHDERQYQITRKFLTHLPKFAIFIHCKNVTALEWCKWIGIENYFFHNTDDVTLTSSGYFWTYPNSKITLIPNHSIPVIVSKENLLWEFEQVKNCYGICTDDAYYYKSKFNS